MSAEQCRHPARIVGNQPNCGTVVTARRAAVLVDGDVYFRTLDACLRQAKRSVFIIGWDFDASIRLRPDASQEQLGSLLRAAVEANPDLEVRILVWSLAVVHAPGATLPLLFGSEWDQHPRINVRLDHLHPIYAAHHQKIVCIDDAVAFVGGIDLTVGRWDTAPHLAVNSGRMNPDGKTYGPVHDLQMLLDGPGAQALSSVARERWRRATGEQVHATECGELRWPADVVPDFENVRLAVSCTSPAWGNAPAVCDSIELALRALRTARHFVYLETQYFASRRVGELLSELLERRDGPEIVVITTKTSRGVLERLVMGNNRDRLARRLARGDRFGRFRIYYPVLSDGHHEKEIKVHSKLMVVDDRFLRLGSSNFNNRSEGLDTECDVAIEAETERERRAIDDIASRLLAEHLRVPRDALESAAGDSGSVIGAIEMLNRDSHALRSLLPDQRRGPERPVLGTALLDPARPLEPAWLLRRRK